MKVLACRCGLVCAFAIALAAAPADAHASRTVIRGSQLAHHLRAGVPISENGLVVRGPVNLAGADAVRRVFECHRCTFKGPILAHDVTFDRTVDLSGSIFGKRVDFSGATFHAPALFRAIEPAGGSDLPDECVSPSAPGQPACFRGPASFGLAVFDDFASFSGSQFVQPASFADVRFSDATFDQTGFGRGAAFDGAAFRTHANFNGAMFDGTASFGGTDFRGLTDFSGATFGAGGDFTAAQFAVGASFLASEFDATPDEDQAARFQSVTAGGDLNFTFALFTAPKNVDVSANFAELVSGGSLVFRPARVPERFALSMGKLQVRDLNMDVGFVSSVNDPDPSQRERDQRAVLSTIENSAKARGDLSEANDAHYAFQKLKSRHYWALWRALDYVFYRGVAGYLVRPLRPLLVLLALATLISLFQLARLKTTPEKGSTEKPNPPRPPRSRRRRVWQGTRRRCTDFLTCMLDTFALLAPRRGEARTAAPALAQRLESFVFRLLLVCALLGLANSNPTLRQMVDTLF